ncbi:MAG TPA: DUF72 domain-containing protein [Gemmatimonadales bacterium]|nr:DUF72 domain-containing protein [Gemmatimonadales bacterium]
MPADVLIGTQGWNYDAWIGPFYPPGSRSADLLGIYARAFPTVEVDSTFYGPPPDAVVTGWRDRAPDAFRFALKVPQEITHEHRLREADEALARFLARASLLGGRLAVLLLQMPPDWGPTPATRDDLDRFLASLPADRRWAIEFRDPRWLEPSVLDRLRARHVALACADGRWIRRERVLEALAEPTAPFAYVRWMGTDRHLTEFSRVQLDREEELETWAAALRRLLPRVDTVYGYVNNHFQGHGPASARAIQRLLGAARVEPAELRTQGELF